MAREKILLRAVNPLTHKTVKAELVNSQYTAECLAASWHMDDKTRTANIYVGDTLLFGCEHPEKQESAGI